ncbi:zinc finger MYM-type protein 1-like [Sitophilus oryzae]|uniref:Zinc finger MYM-type protein 1-like n=1 Tax=Sitophilus oryzae TaxID=7048 RepID=A0A6J2Y3X6_SITOR|nr:zinc finger MYM-type protein 1-like [Sitophilus oryzae]
MEGPSTVLVDNNDVENCVCIVCCILKSGFSSRSFLDKTNIINSGRPMDLINLETKVEKSTKKFTRHFHLGFYEKYDWLTGCKNVSKLFCWPCLLFNTSEKSHWNSVGITDLNNFHKSLKRHVNNKYHLFATVEERTFGKCRIEHILDDHLQISDKIHNERVTKNKDVLKRLIDATCFLGEHKLSFRGHNEATESVNGRNFMDLLNFLAKYDETLKNHFIDSAVFRGTSNTIQNDLNKCIAEVVGDHIKNEIRKAPFVSIALHETTDITNLSRISIVVRYVLDGIVQERFLGFLDITSDRTADAMFKIVCDIVSSLECGSKLVAQSYDGAAVMAGHLGGLQAKVKEKFQHAIFVHCLTHKIDLVLARGLDNIKNCKVFFSTLSSLASFFSKSSKRTHTLDTHVQKRFPKAAPTRWNYNGSLVQTVFEYRDSLIDFFQDVWHNKEKWDGETVTAAEGFLHWLKGNFDFNFLLNVFAEIFPFTGILFEILRLMSNEIGFCMKQIDYFKNEIIKKRDQFQNVWNKTENMDLESEIKRIRIDNVGDRETSYHRLYLEIFDNILQQIDSRFRNFNELKFVELCNFNLGKNYDSSKFPTVPFNSLKLNYENFFDIPALYSQLSVAYETTEISDKETPLNVLNFLKTTGLNKSLYEVAKLCELVLTMRATSASGEKGFSALKRIKCFMRNSTSEDGNLALLCIEKECVQKLSENPKFYDDVIDKFAAVDRRIDLKYKDVHCAQKSVRTAISEGESTKEDKSLELGKSWSTILHGLELEQQRIAEKAITSILTEAHRGKLDQYSVIINGLPCVDL